MKRGSRAQASPRIYRLKGYPSKTFGQKGRGGANVDDIGRGGWGGWYLTGRPETNFVGCFGRVSFGVQHPPLHPWASNIFSVSDVFTRNRLRFGRPRWGRGVLAKRSMLDRGEGGCPKSQFLLGGL